MVPLPSVIRWPISKQALGRARKYLMPKREHPCSFYPGRFAFGTILERQLRQGRVHYQTDLVGGHFFTALSLWRRLAGNGPSAAADMPLRIAGGHFSCFLLTQASLGDDGKYRSGG